MAEHETPLAELFATNPLKLSDQDINRIIEKLRSQRKAFVAGNKSAGKPTNKITKTDKLREEAKKAAGDILDQIDLGF